MARATLRELPKNIGRYEVVRQLGVGAMGRVLLARDPILERHVAVKILRDDLAIPSDVRDALVVRMRHEARAAARVTHPHLVVVHDMGEDDELGLFLVFEYIEGPTLKERLLQGRLSARQAARICREIGTALTYAHDRGVLHRDVKPENIIISPTGSKLTDFGIARVPDSTLTFAGGLLGTPAYSAPETFRDSNFSAESDQFSLAATLYEAIRGERAFPGDDAVSVASRIANDAPEPFALGLRYPAQLDAILARGMARAPAERWPSCKEFGIELMEALMLRSSLAAKNSDAVTDRESTLPLARLSGLPDQTSSPPPADRRGLRVLVGGFAALVAVGVAVRVLLKSEAPSAAAASAAVEEPPTASVEPPPPPPVATASATARPARRRPDPRPALVSSSPTTASSEMLGSSSAGAAAPSASVSVGPPGSASTAPPAPSGSAASSAAPTSGAR